MKILTKEEEEAHYNATLKGGLKGGLFGLVVVRCLLSSRSLYPSIQIYMNHQQKQ